jgi:hypothetical protein
MYVKTSALASISAILVSVLGCASAPAPQETANGRVLAAAEQKIPQGQPLGGALRPMPQGGFAAPSPAPQPFPSTYVYDLKLDDGRTVRIQSPMRFGIGDCVRLSAAEISAGTVRGTLAKGSDCK